MNTTQADRGAGCLVAQALGDALGFLVEGHHPVICAHFVHETFAEPDPPTRLRGPFSFGQYSDDTQLARELALSLLERGGWDPPDYASRMGGLFREDTIVGRGKATEAAAERILAGVRWDHSGEPPPSAGNGASMRVAPIGLRFSEPSERWRIADEQARITHLDPRSRAAAILVADVVACALSGNMSTDYRILNLLAERVVSLDPALAAGIGKIPYWILGTEAKAAEEISLVGSAPAGTTHKFEEWHGISPFATPSTLYALYAFLRSPNDAEAVLARSVAVGGDVDTVAAMAGAMAGAHVGLSGLSPRLRRWAHNLNDQGSFGLDELVALGEGLAR